MVQYKYDAWGGIRTEVKDETHAGIAELNPFRYRSYYYDRETNLYYLNTRYYDPETGRFISQDDVSYLDPEHINGLNLFAYCNNNPVMKVDPRMTKAVAVSMQIFFVPYFSAKQLKTMAKYLEIGRADTYKEALNLYIGETAEQEYRDKMLQKDKENKRKLSEAEKAKRNAEMSARIAERKAQQEAKKRDEEIKNLLKKLENK